MCQTARTDKDVEAMNRMTCADAMKQFFAYLDRVLSGEPLDALEVKTRGNEWLGIEL